MGTHRWETAGCRGDRLHGNRGAWALSGEAMPLNLIPPSKGLTPGESRRGPPSLHLFPLPLSLYPFLSAVCEPPAPLSDPLHVTHFILYVTCTLSAPLSFSMIPRVCLLFVIAPSFPWSVSLCFFLFFFVSVSPCFVLFSSLFPVALCPLLVPLSFFPFTFLSFCLPISVSPFLSPLSLPFSSLPTYLRSP